MKKFTLLTLAMAALGTVALSAEPVKFKAVFNNDRYDDHADHFYSTYVGYNSDLQRSIFIVENGIYAMELNGNTLSAPVKDPAVNISDFFEGNPWPGTGHFTDNDKAAWAADFNMMYGNSGAVKYKNFIYTVTSRTPADDVDSTNIFAVRKWDATTGDLLSAKDDYYPQTANLQSAGMCVNPKDGKVYGLFYLTDVPLSDEITSDPDYFPEVTEEGDTIESDAGYAICTIDLETMEVTPVTPGLYYQNFVTFAINSEGRAFALTSGAVPGYEDEDGRIRDIDGNLSGATLFEFDLKTGLMLTVEEEAVDEDGNTYTANVNKYRNATGYSSQAKRQSACFSKKDPNKMYWTGFYNSGMGYNDYGNWANLPDRDWKTNGKYDTSFYEVDITTGEARRIANFDNRYSFSAMWVVEDDDNTLRGDVNRDGVVNAADITALYNYLLNGDTTYIETSDVNEDGNITAADITAVYSIMMGAE